MNNCCMFVTCPVSKCERSSSVSVESPQNMLSIVVTWDNVKLGPNVMDSSAGALSVMPNIQVTSFN